MKKILIIALQVVTIFTANAQKKKDKVAEKYGNTLNVGAGVGYYGYIHNPLPVFNVNFEIGIVDNFTLAPFVALYSYRNNDYGFNTNPNGYTYRETVAPIGIKGTYYFDRLLRASAKWDFYAAGSVAVLARRVAWHEDYYGPQTVYHRSNPLYADAHIGAEYHFSQKAGVFFDASTGVSTVGLAIHF